MALLGAAAAVTFAAHRILRGEPSDDRYGWYRAVLELEGGGALPFYLYLPQGGEPAVLLNDREEIPVRHRWDGDAVSIELVHYSWRIDAARGAGGELAGALVLDHPIYDPYLLPGEERLTTPLHARRVPRPDPGARFTLAERRPAPGSLTGSWRLVPDEPVDHSRPGESVIYKLVLEQSGDEVRGDVILDTGTLRFMAGNARGDAFALAGVDGSHFALLRGTLDKPDRMTGELFLLRKRTRFYAERVSELPYREVQRPLPEVTVADWRPAGLERYRGKPVIVEVFGTWCSNCNDAAPLLRELYERHRADGLEIVAFAIEATDDPALAGRLVERYVKRHRIPWQVITVTTEEHLAELMRPFHGTSAVPIFAFLRRDGSLAGTHVGYIGPAAPADHLALRAELERLAREIAASR